MTLELVEAIGASGRGKAARTSPRPPAEHEAPGPAGRAGAETAELAEAFFPSPEDVHREIAHVLTKQLSPALERWAEGYDRVGRRNHYLWQWARQGVEVTMLSCVPPALRDEVCDTKVLGVILDVLLDDVADQNGDDAFLEYLLTLPREGELHGLDQFAPELQAYARFTGEVWQEIHARARRYPCYAAYADLLRYDYQQLFNAMRYSHLLNRQPALLNLTEHDLYLPHNMHMMISATLDLMCSPDFDPAELGRLREAVWHGQCMGRIGNLTTTWERELGEGDYTSGVYARALAHGDVTLADLRSGDREQIRSAIRNGRHEDFFLRRWQEHRENLLARRAQVHSADVGVLVQGLQRLICLHLGSRGYK
jgi:hypothetical protein